MKRLLGYSMLLIMQLAWGQELNVDALCDKADMILFSYDRPLQLDGFLRSIERYMIGVGTVQVIYRASNSSYDRAFDECFKQHAQLSLILKKQGDNPRDDFKKLTMQALAECSHDYILFAVDDIIFKDYTNLSECIAYLKSLDAYGFYLRMGENITFSYTQGKPSPLPSYQLIDDKIMKWKLSDGGPEWCFPHTVDVTVYRKSSVIDILSRLDFFSPSTLESAWALRGIYMNRAYEKYGICYKFSKTVNIPFNLVQEDWRTARNMGYSKDDFLRMFNEGARIDITRYFKIINEAPHIELPIYLL